MLIADRNGMMVGKRLPYDAEVEYLQSVKLGTAFDDGLGTYILTNYTPTLADKISLRVFISSTSNAVFGTNYGWGARAYTINGREAWIGSSVKWLSSIIANSWMDIVIDPPNNILTVNGSSAWTIPEVSGEPIRPIYLFGIYYEVRASVAYIPDGTRLAEISAERNGEKILDMISVRFTNENNISEGAMYDRVSGELFRNAGTGAFVIGPDIPASAA